MKNKLYYITIFSTLLLPLSSKAVSFIHCTSSRYNLEISNIKIPKKKNPFKARESAQATIEVFQFKGGYNHKRTDQTKDTIDQSHTRRPQKFEFVISDPYKEIEVEVRSSSIPKNPSLGFYTGHADVDIRLNDQERFFNENVTCSIHFDENTNKI